MPRALGLPRRPTNTQEPTAIGARQRDESEGIQRRDAAAAFVLVLRGMSVFQRPAAHVPFLRHHARSLFST